MRTSFHHQPEAQHPNFQLSTRWQADYPIFRGEADIRRGAASTLSVVNDPQRSSAGQFCCNAQHRLSERTSNQINERIASKEANGDPHDNCKH
jgi:hypothetical protein